MSILFFLAAGLLANAAPAASPEPISIRAGETIVLRFDGDKPVLVGRSEAQPMNDFDWALLRRMQIESEQAPAGQTVLPPSPVMREDVPVDPPPVTAGVVQLTFRRVSGFRPGSNDHSLLTLANGTKSSFRYRAVMRGNGRSAPTDVCEVMPEKFGHEHWPYVIEQLDLSDVRLEQFQEGRIRCQ